MPPKNKGDILLINKAECPLVAFSALGGLMRLLATQGYINGARSSDGKTLKYSLTTTGTELAAHPERVGLAQTETLLPVEW